MKRFFPLSFFLCCSLVFSPLLCAENGDVNTDGEITTDDVLLLLEMATGKQPADLSFDMNADGYISSQDAFAIFELINDTDPLIEELQSVIFRYDVGDYFSDERMNWEISRTNGSTLFIALVIENGNIVEFREGTVKDPSINAFTSEKTIRDLLNSKDSKALREAWDNGEIRIDGVGIGNAIRIGFMGFVNWITGPFT